MKRGELWIAAAGGTYASTPRPVVILQDNRFDTDSIAVCPLTTDPQQASLLRVPVQPHPDNGLRQRSFVMADKISTIRRKRMGTRIGTLAAADLAALERAVVVFLGLAGSGDR